MSTMLAKITREPALIIGVITSGFGLAILFGVNITQEQIGGVVLFAGAVMALVRFVTTPAKDVVVQVKDGTVVAGPAAVAATGSELRVIEPHPGSRGAPSVAPVPVNPGLVDDQIGAIDVGTAIVIAVLALIFLALLGAFGAVPLR